ncbi:hypothetical protein K439DRAFT_1661654 [Ramaria rubella]|nr:hypothetical protein K439DRAFT_1661654 [Ramaria rubella]
MPPPPSDSFSRLGTQACAECRRLKLKCDKNKPCSNCVRRGCASICPQGRMVSKGSRFILADTEQLHEKIDALIGRVHQLESALEKSHSLHSSEPHPLLGVELRLIATPVDSKIPSNPELAQKEKEMVDTMGILTLDNRGTRYFGWTGAFAHMWRLGEDPDDAAYKHNGAASLALAGVPVELAQMAHAFPIRLPTFYETHFKKWILENCLPSFPEAWSLFENYWEHYAWHFTPFTRSMFVEKILSPLYHRSLDNEDTPLGHRLGLLFMVFAIGDLMDLTKAVDASTGLRYYLLARASLCLDPVFESPTVTALQATYLMGVFLMLARGTNEPEHSWILSGINSKLALTLGLQHDATKFNLSPEEVENRRYVLVSVISAELWQCLGTGRPISQTFANFEWVLKQPHSADEVREKPTESFSVEHERMARNWLTTFIWECSSKVLEAAVGNKATSYSAILQLDAKIREHPLPTFLIDKSRDPEDLGIGITMQHLLMSVIKEVSLLFLHRRCFAIALRDSPNDPLRSHFAPSVMACYRSATNFISGFSTLHSTTPELLMRIWFFWPNAFVSTLILGTIVARSPNCPLASSALLTLENACSLWEVIPDSVCGARVLSTIKQLKEKAFTSFARSKANDPLAAATEGVETLEEIHALGGGGPRVISKKSPSSASGSSPYTADQKIPSDSFPSATAGISSSSNNQTFAYPTYNIPVAQQLAFPPMEDPVDNTFLFMHMDNMPDLENYDFTQFTASEEPLPESFNDIFRRMDTHQYPPANPTGWEKFGLGEEWRDIMDHFDS